MPSNAAKAVLLRKFHAICTQQNMTPDEKAALVGSYGHDSSKDFTVAQLKDVISKLEPKTQTSKTYGGASPDQWRKRVMASIGSWLKLAGKESNANVIKSIACRATGYTNFNSIPAARLSNLYNEFRKKSTDAESVQQVKAEEIKHLENNN